MLLGQADRAGQEVPEGLERLYRQRLWQALPEGLLLCPGDCDGISVPFLPKLTPCEYWGQCA